MRAESPDGVASLQSLRAFELAWSYALQGLFMHPTRGQMWSGEATHQNGSLAHLRAQSIQGLLLHSSFQYLSSCMSVCRERAVLPGAEYRTRTVHRNLAPMFQEGSVLCLLAHVSVMLVLRLAPVTQNQLTCQVAKCKALGK